MKRRVEPLGHRLLIKVDEKESTTAAGIIIPDASKETQVTGTVVTQGTPKELRFEAGNRVLFKKFIGVEVQHLGEPHLIVREEDIIAVLHDAD